MNEVPKIVHQRLRVATPARETLEQTHPDADVLTAFSEQALAASEREDVLQHLALCADCRDVVALALPEMAATFSPMEEERSVVGDRAASEHRKSRFSWASLSWAHLRWATLAAGIAVAVFLVRPGFERMGNPHPPVDSAANQISPAAQPALALQAPGAMAVNSAATAKNAPKDAEKSAAAEGARSINTDGKIASDKVKVKVKSLESLPGANMPGADTVANTIAGLDGRHPFSPQPLSPQTTALPSEQSDMQLVGTLGAVGGSVNQNADRLKKDTVSAGLSGAPRRELGAAGSESRSGTPNSAAGKSVVGSSSEMVAVVAGPSTQVESTAETISDEPILTARADQPTLQDAPAVIKSKPAVDGTATRDAAVTGATELGKTSAGKSSTSVEVASLQAQATPRAKTRASMMASAPDAMQKQSAKWRIADGVFQHSQDGGLTWQMAARAEHALLCYANVGQEVWTGGQAGTLLHSVDNGATWSAVAVSFNGQRLGSDVTHLDVRLIPGPAAQIVLSTGNHETWSSSDGGKTWEKN